MKQPKVEDFLPSFQAKDHEGNLIKSQNLLGVSIVIHFFSDTQSQENIQLATDFRNHTEEFDDAEALIIGISPGIAQDNEMFVEKHGLNFLVLSDEKGELSTKFGISKANIPVTFVASSDGIIQWIKTVENSQKHIKEVLGALDEYCTE